MKPEEIVWESNMLEALDIAVSSNFWSRISLI